MATEQNMLVDVEPMLKDVPFMSAERKGQVLRQWELFLASGLAPEKFTSTIYDHLHLHCSFIAHYDKWGFFSTYFRTGEGREHFLSQFDDRETPKPTSVEYGGTHWLIGDHEDINREMIRVARKYIPVLIAEARVKQRASDLAEATKLLARHGIELKIT